jgi:ABC-2 type transport system ATP-binding protein
VEFTQTVEIASLEQIEGVLKVSDKGKFIYELEATADKDVRPAVFSLATQKGWALVGLRQEETTLEAIFQDLTKSDKTA